VLDRSGHSKAPCANATDCRDSEACIDGQCRSTITDAGSDGGGADAGSRPPDAGAPDAGGVPPHCLDGIAGPGESDVDCGGECAPCGGCRACELSVDCASDDCVDGRCRPILRDVRLPGLGTDVRAQVEGDRVLLAHYAPHSWQRSYDPGAAQLTSAACGDAAPAGWAPDACIESGHLALEAIASAGHRVVLECGVAGATPSASVGSLLFDSFASGSRGTPGAPGTPGWAAIARQGSAHGRHDFEMCGNRIDDGRRRRGGIAYCDGLHAGEPFDNHLVSYTTHYNVGPWIGCDRRGCAPADATCDLHVWVWLEL
jgi:hypothetical protein